MRAVALRTIPACRPLSPEERRVARMLAGLDEPLPQRPRTRGDCLPGGSNAMRPCPFVSCKYHLAVEVTAIGSLVHNHPGREIDELPETCALDVADRGEKTLEELGRILGVTRERARQIAEDALMDLHAELRARRGLTSLRDTFCPSEPCTDDEPGDQP